MSKRDEFIAEVKGVKSTFSNITDDQRQDIIRKGMRDYGLTRDEAEKILTAHGPKVGPTVNYFDVLGLKIEDIEKLNEAEIEKRVKEAHAEPYDKLRIQSGRTGREERLKRLDEAKAILIDPQKRTEHIAEILGKHHDGYKDDEKDKKDPQRQSARTIIKFRNGDEATSIPQLATLMEKNAKEATDILYQGDLALGLAGAGQTPFASAARAVVNQFSGDRQTGLMAMVAVLRKTVKMSRGTEAKTPQQLARSIDKNWEEAKTLLYNGFFALWLEYTNETQLAGTAKKIVSQYGNQQDIGLEELVQRLDPHIGKPEPEVSQSEIDFGNMNSESQKTIQFRIKNVGRGFLYGNVRFASNMPGLQISRTKINGKGVVTVKLNASALTVKQKHQASLVVDTNGGTVKVPVSCYITYPVQNSIQRLAVSGFSMAAIAIVTRLIIQQFGSSGWLATRLTGAGFTEWEQHWNWVEWFEWPWFEWSVYTLSAPKAGMEFVIALAALGVGIFAYWHFILKKKGGP